jgi:rubrerythrin
MMPSVIGTVQANAVFMIGKTYQGDPQEVSISCVLEAYDGPAVEEHTMTTLKGSKTHQNLKDAFAGESQANRRYLFFAKVADIEGYPEVAGNFKETADGETGHAHGHLDYLKSVGDPATGLPIGDTALNLKAAIAGETHEYTDMYPGMAKNAREEGFAEIADWFETLAKAEKSHAGRFQKMLDSIS